MMRRPPTATRPSHRHAALSERPAGRAWVQAVAGCRAEPVRRPPRRARTAKPPSTARRAAAQRGSPCRSTPCRPPRSSMACNRSSAAQTPTRNTQKLFRAGQAATAGQFMFLPAQN
eukprot:scaffold36549_cov62-Phaeocystis_antarctica.AAC.3